MTFHRFRLAVAAVCAALLFSCTTTLLDVLGDAAPGFQGILGSAVNSYLVAGTDDERSAVFDTVKLQVLTSFLGANPQDVTGLEGEDITAGARAAAGRALADQQAELDPREWSRRVELLAAAYQAVINGIEARERDLAESAAEE